MGAHNGGSRADRIVGTCVSRGWLPVRFPSFGADLNSVGRIDYDLTKEEPR